MVARDGVVARAAAAAAAAAKASTTTVVAEGANPGAPALVANSRVAAAAVAGLAAAEGGGATSKCPSTMRWLHSSSPWGASLGAYSGGGATGGGLGGGRTKPFRASSFARWSSSNRRSRSRRSSVATASTRACFLAAARARSSCATSCSASLTRIASFDSWTSSRCLASAFAPTCAFAPRTRTSSTAQLAQHRSIGPLVPQRSIKASSSRARCARTQSK